MSGEMMSYPENIEQFLDKYSFLDKKEVYTNGSELIPVFRVKQALERYMPRWIPVSERLPEESLNSVIGWDEYRERCVFIQFVDGQFKNCGTEQTFNITAWMPLPEPYKEN